MIGIKIWRSCAPKIIGPWDRCTQLSPPCTACHIPSTRLDTSGLLSTVLLKAPVNSQSSVFFSHKAALTPRSIDMAGTKRALDETSAPKAKKAKVDKTKKKDKPAATAVPSSLLTEDTDFPRGGGTSFTPLEVKAIRAEAAQEADQELFKVRFKILGS